MGVVAGVVLLFRIFLTYLEAFYRIFVQPERKSIRRKVVLITGAGRGLGKQLALKFSEAGARLVLWDINEEEVQETAADVTSAGGSAHAFKCDVTSAQNVKETATRVRAEVGEVDMVVNNAGVMNIKRSQSLTEKEIRRTFDVNVISHFFINQEFLPRMLEQNEGHIVTIASLAGKFGSALMTDYCASKFAAFGYTEALAHEIRRVYKKTGVKTTTICPMFINTNLVHQHDSKIEYVPGPEGIMEPEDVAEAILDGVLRNRTEVYIPDNYKRVDTGRAIIPRKARLLLADHLGTGFYEK